MSAPAIESAPIIAVLGNPNTGKSTLFNALTGSKQRTGNYPGVTVERRMGRLKYGQMTLELLDLPGTYSLAPHSPDEMLAVQVLLGTGVTDRIPDLILCVVDASNLQRNLFLVSQLLDLNRPLVVALNMTDVARRRRIEIDANELEKLLGVPVIPVQANKRSGIESLKHAIVQAVNNPPKFAHDPFSEQLRGRIKHLHETCPDDCQLKNFVVTRMLFDGDGFMTSRLQNRVGLPMLESLKTQQRELVEATGISIAEQESQARYNWITANSNLFIKRPGNDTRKSISSLLDQWLTHSFWGLLIAVAVMLVLFQLVFRAAEPASAGIDWFKGTLANGVNYLLAPGALQSLIVNGVIEGVGSVLVFLPQILVLFLILAALEDSGYLARASYLMDRYLSRVGLGGVSLIPLLSSFACAIPGIMATRVITDSRERLLTILVAPLMSCSARLPVYILMIAAFVPKKDFLWGFVGLQALVMLAMYLIGVVVAIGVAWVLRRFLLPGQTGSFVMELPPYKVPQWIAIYRRMREGGWAFVRNAGTLIVAVTVLVWAAAYFPRSEHAVPQELQTDLGVVSQKIMEMEQNGFAAESTDAEALLDRRVQIENKIAAFHLRNSFLGRTGLLIEPIVRPLGWDWRVGSAVIAAFPAREVVVSTMGVIFGLGSDTDENSESLKASLINARWAGTNRPLFTLPMALGLMVFFALCAQCASTLAVIKRETNSWRWPVFSFCYMTCLAYIAAFLTYQLGSML